jgi:hypothetical protein
MKPLAALSFVLALSTAFAAFGCSASSGDASEEDTGALENGSKPSPASLETAASIRVFADDAVVVAKKGDAAFTAALSALNLEQSPFDASRIPVAFCPSTVGAQFLNESGKLVGAVQLPCSAKPAKSNEVIAMVATSGDDEAQFGIKIDGLALVKVAQGGGSASAAADGALAPLAAATSLIVYADDSQRTIKKSDADFVRVLDAVDLAQKPFDASEIAVPFCASTVGVRFMGDGNKLIGALGIICGQAPGKRNEVIVSVGDNDLGIAVNGSSIAQLAAAK